MTKRVLVMDGNEVKMRLMAERRHSNGLVHVDWVRFTCDLRHAPLPSVDSLFPLPLRSTVDNPLSRYEEEMGMTYAQMRQARLMAILRSLPDPDFAASAQAHALAERVCECLGPDFSIEPELKKGQDFYRHRWSIVRNDFEVAWVGFLASGDSPRQSAQSKTIHVNLFGSACTFANRGWLERMAALVEDVEGRLTRVDYALDFFDGLQGGLDRVWDDWHAGLMDVKGRRPKANTVGPWVQGGRGRSFYFGSKEAGKQTNVYEKGVQLFGELDATRWERVELRYGNKLRELSPDMLLRPDDFFAGASDWHQSMLAEAGRCVTGEPVKVRSKQAIETVQAEVTRVVRWLTNTAGASLAFAVEYLGLDELNEVITARRKPGRLERFSSAEISSACASLSIEVYQPKVRSIGLSGA